MSEPPADPEPVSVVIPVHNAAAVLDKAVGVWLDALGKLGRDYELIVVDDGSTDGTAEKAEQLAARRSEVRLLRHESRRGFGACLRTAFAEARHPLVFYTALDYPYTPSDLGKLLDRIADTDPILGRRLDAVSGCRTGRPVPAAWRAVGFAFRLFCRAALGLKLDPLPGWVGFREHLRSWVAWVVFGDPLTDPNSAFKLFRRPVLERFPVQSDGDFVHVELVAKATFTICLMDELPLTPNPAPIPPTEWGEFWKLLRNAKFTPPPVAPPESPESAAAPP
jgi:glycosyltransferase involved in cell wall biosynthesis